MQHRHHGFTLIEILIAVVIIGILAGIALPQYGRYLSEARRTDAHIALRGAAQQLERCRTQTFAYNHADCSFTTTSPDGHYSIASSGVTATAYVLTATPVTTSPQANDDDCAAFTLNATGVTGATDSSNAANNECW